MRGYHKFFVIISIIFLLVVLYQGEYLHIPDIHSYPLLLLSFAFLVLAFSSASITWHMILNKNDYPIAIKDAIISQFLSIFGKYIPGKFWAVFGRSVYIKDKFGYPLHQISTLSGINQLQITWSGFAFGIAGALLLNLEWYINLILIFSWLLLSLLLFSTNFYNYLQSAINKIFKKDYKLPFVGFKKTMYYIPFLLIHWLIWFVAFFLFIEALSLQSISPLKGFAFPLSGTIGNIIAIAPGGFGVREGVMSYFLHESGLKVEQAISLSISARVWYLCGEVIVFLFALLRR